MPASSRIANAEPEIPWMSSKIEFGTSKLRANSLVDTPYTVVFGLNIYWRAPSITNLGSGNIES